MPQALSFKSETLIASRGRVMLRAAGPSDLLLAYQWFAHSDLTRELMGPPLYPDRPVVDLDQFRGAHPPHIFSAITPFEARGWVIAAGGDEVGFLRHGRVDLLRDVVELDVWLAARRYCGHGYGSEALGLACEMLQAECGVNRFVLRPSLRNVHALRAMRRAGFRELGLDARQVAAKLALRASDYVDEVLLFRVLPLPPAHLARDPARRYVYIDSEFTSLEQPRLISLGAIDDRGRTFYREVDGWDESSCSAFVRDMVLPLLDGRSAPRAQAAVDFVAWLQEVAAGAPVTLVSDSGFDRWAVAELLHRPDLPQDVLWQRVPIAYAELDRFAVQLGLRRHHALDDAMALRDAIQRPES